MTCSFADLGLAVALTRAAADQGYTTPTPVQVQAIPAILAGRDVLAGAQTGTGKTAGFALPLLQRLASRANGSTSPARHPVRALILTPTRELAAQVEQSVRTYGRHLPLRSTVVYGGVGINPQMATLRRGVDILVATPGRLLDHVQQRTVDLSRVEILVLDEADRMLDMGFIRDIRRILSLLPAIRQNLLFSATFTDEIRGLADGLLKNPELIQVVPNNTEVELISQRAHPVSQDRKRHLLSHLVKSQNWSQVLVFTRTKHGANRLAEQLERDGIQTTAIHGNKSQPQRSKALAQFKAGEVRVLVATDIAARGLDIDALPHVVNYDMPHVPEDYIHRIGRTGRAGNTGEAISLVSPEERGLLAAIERLIGRRIERQPMAGFEAVAGNDPQPIAPRPAPLSRDRYANSTPRAHRPAPARGKQPAHASQRDTERARPSQPVHHVAAKPERGRHDAEAIARRRAQGTTRPASVAKLLGGSIHIAKP